jgi:hypothetical protein
LGKELEFRDPAEKQIREHEYKDIVRQVLAEQFPRRLPQQREELADQLTAGLDAIVQQLSQDNIRQVSVTAPDQSD